MLMTRPRNPAAHWPAVKTCPQNVALQHGGGRCKIREYSVEIIKSRRMEESDRVLRVGPGLAGRLQLPTVCSNPVREHHPRVRPLVCIGYRKHAVSLLNFIATIMSSSQLCSYSVLHSVDQLMVVIARICLATLLLK